MQTSMDTLCEHSVLQFVFTHQSLDNYHTNNFPDEATCMSRGHSPTVRSPRDKPATNAVEASGTRPQHHGVTTTLHVANSNAVATAMSMLTMHQPIKMAAKMAPTKTPPPPAT